MNKLDIICFLKEKYILLFMKEFCWGEGKIKFEFDLGNVEEWENVIIYYGEELSKIWIMGNNKGKRFIFFNKWRVREKDRKRKGREKEGLGEFVG